MLGKRFIRQIKKKGCTWLSAFGATVSKMMMQWQSFSKLDLLTTTTTMYRLVSATSAKLATRKEDKLWLVAMGIRGTKEKYA